MDLCLKTHFSNEFAHERIKSTLFCKNRSRTQNFKNLKFNESRCDFWKYFDANHVYEHGETLCNQNLNQKTTTNSKPICVHHVLQNKT